MARRGTGWDAAAYEDVSTVQARWGKELLDSFQWRGDEVVVDAGCGPGNLTEEILGRIPGGSVVAIDVDASMIAAARKRLAPQGDRARVLHADLLDPAPVHDADLVFSNAAIHWIPDHERLFRAFHSMLRPGGRLLVQGGGLGNLDTVRRTAEGILRDARFVRAFSDWEPPWNYAGVHATLRNLGRAGFTRPEATLHPAPVTFRDDAAFRAFLDAVILRTYHAHLPHKEQASFTEAFMAAVGDRTLDYVRLTVRAVA